MIRVLQVFGALDCGGAETMLMNIYRNIDREKVQFDFIVHTDKKCYYDEEIDTLGGKIYRCPHYNVVNHFVYKKWWDDFFINHPEYKIIHSHMRSTASILLRVAKKHGLTTIAHSHSTSNGKGIKAIVKKFLQRNIVKYADYKFACSIDGGKWLFGDNIVSDKSFKVIPNAIDVDKYIYSEETRKEIREELKINKDDFVIGHIGRFVDVKNHLFIIDVFNDVQKVNPKAKLLLIGDGELRTAIDTKIASLGLQDKVILTGVRSDIPRLLNAMDIFVLPSKFEGLGIVLIEAQANGLKCIASDMVPNETKMSSNIEYLMLDKEEWIKTINKCHDISRQDNIDIIKHNNYDIKVTAKIIEEFYLTVQ